MLSPSMIPVPATLATASPTSKPAGETQISPQPAELEIRDLEPNTAFMSPPHNINASQIWGPLSYTVLHFTDLINMTWPNSEGMEWEVLTSTVIQSDQRTWSLRGTRTTSMLCSSTCREGTFSSGNQTRFFLDCQGLLLKELDSSTEISTLKLKYSLDNVPRSWESSHYLEDCLK